MSLRVTRNGKLTLLVAIVAGAGLSAQAFAASCGDGPKGFEAWKKEFAEEARGQGVRAKGIAALMRTSYSAATIRADRSQKSFKLSLAAFMQKRGAPASNVSRAWREFEALLSSPRLSSDLS